MIAAVAKKLESGVIVRAKHRLVEDAIDEVEAGDADWLTRHADGLCALEALDEWLSKDHVGDVALVKGA